MLRSRNNNKNAHPANAIESDAPAQTSSFTKLGVFICISFIVVVSYFAFADNKSFTSSETNSIEEASHRIVSHVKSHKSPITSAMTAKMNRGGLSSLLRPKVLSDLKPDDNDRLQRLMDRQDRFLGLNKLNRKAHPLRPLQALNMDNDDSDTKEVSFRLESSIFVRQVSPIGGENTHDFVLLFLHGAAYSSATWSELGILSALAKQGYISYALDVPGYGLSAEGRATNNKWLYQVIDQLCDKDDKAVVTAGGVSTLRKDVIVVTASMSGRFAVPLLFQPPSNLVGMITVAPVSTERFEPEQYKKVQVPVCVVYGEQDKGLGEKSKANLIQIPNHRLVMVPNGEHAAYKTDPKFFYREVTQWLSEFFN